MDVILVILPVALALANLALRVCIRAIRGQLDDDVPIDVNPPQPLAS